MDNPLATLSFLFITMSAATINIWLVHLLFISGGGRHNHILRPLSKKFGETPTLAWALIGSYTLHLVSALAFENSHTSYTLLSILLVISLWNCKRDYDSYRRLRNMLESQEP